MSGAEGLVERLRGFCIDWDGREMQDGEPPRVEPYCSDLRDAADALTTAEARNRELEAALRECESIAKQANAMRVRGPILTTTDRFVMIQDRARRTLRGE